MEQFDALGVFWLPDATENSRVGMLQYRYDPEGVRLVLFGPFEPIPELLQTVQHHAGYPVILGTLDSGDLVTLTGAQIGNASLVSSSNVATMRLVLQAIRIYRGAHLPSGEATALRGVRLRFQHLGPWAAGNERVVDHELASAEVDGGFQEQVFTTNTPDDIECDAFDGQLKIRFSNRVAIEGPRLTVERDTLLEYRPTEQQTLAGMFDQAVQPLQYFLTFSCGVAVQLTSLDVEIEGLGVQIEEFWRPTWVEVGQSGWRGHLMQGAPTQMRLPLPQIADRLGTVLAGWARLQQSQDRSMMLLFAISLGIDLYVDTRFIFAVQAIELYHRRRWPEGVLSKMEHKARIKSIVDSVADKGLRRWIREKLAYSNEPTLRQRLDEVLAYAGKPIAKVLRPDFQKAAADTRNYLTHYDDRLRNKAETGDGLYLLGVEAIVLLEVCFLRELGFDVDDAFAMTARTQNLQMLMQRRGMIAPFRVTVTNSDASEEPSGDAPEPQGTHGAP